MKQIRDAMVPGVDVPKSDEFVNFERTFIEKWQAAQTQARKELGKLYALVEMGEEATVDGLISDLVVQERLDAMIDKCLKHLLAVFLQNGNGIHEKNNTLNAWLMGGNRRVR